MYNRYYFPPAHHTLLGRVTLVAILLAGGSGIAWDLTHTSPAQLNIVNAQLDAAHDALLVRTAAGRSGGRADTASLQPVSAPDEQN